MTGVSIEHRLACIINRGLNVGWGGGVRDAESAVSEISVESAGDAGTGDDPAIMGRGSEYRQCPRNESVPRAVAQNLQPLSGPPQTTTQGPAVRKVGQIHSPHRQPQHSSDAVGPFGDRGQ